MRPTPEQLREAGRKAMERLRIPCPEAARMGEHACNNQFQCWEPCGELGKRMEHVRVSKESRVVVDGARWDDTNDRTHSKRINDLAANRHSTVEMLLKPPRPTPCVNCGKTRAEHDSKLRCPGLHGKYYTRPEEVR